MARTIVVTGATGNLGPRLLKVLGEAGFTLRILSRDAARAGTVLADKSVEIFDLSQVEEAMSGCEAVVHLGARNNDQDGSVADFIADNVDQTMSLARAAESAGVQRFVFATSTQALRPKDPYGVSKQEAENQLSAFREGAAGAMQVVFARLPAVYSQSARGKLALIQKLPTFLRPLALRVLADLAPMVTVDVACKGLVELLDPSVSVDERCFGMGLAPGPIYRVFQFGVNAAFVFACLVLLPVLLGVWLAVRLTSKGPGLFVQDRVGRGEIEFSCIKFRTMATGTPNGGSHEVGSSYITGLGQWLRKLKLDELPQAINVARGEVNLVGPRPGLSNMLDLTAARQEQDVFWVSPGITGLAQVQGVDMSTPEKLAIYDQRYMATRCVLTDLLAMIATVVGKGGGDAAAKSTDAVS